MQEFRFPDEDRPWIDVARDGAREWRRVLREHPNVMAVWAERQRPMTDLEALMPMEFALRVIARAGLDERDSVQVFNVHRRLHHGRRDDGGRRDVLGGHDARRRDRSMHGLAADDAPTPCPLDRLPHLVASLPYLAECDPDEQFEFGLELLLAGIQATVDRPA